MSKVESERTESPELIKRRNFLAAILKSLGAVFVVGCIYPIIRYLSPTAISGGGSGVDISLDEIPIGEAKKIDLSGQPAMLIRTQKEVIALSAICTHLGCIVDFKKDDNVIRCPCHAAEFDIKGNVIKGPATIPLETYPAKISGNIVHVGGS